jgi:carboxylesterase type B
MLSKYIGAATCALSAAFIASLSLRRRAAKALHPGRRLFAPLDPTKKVQRTTTHGVVEGWHGRTVSTAPERLHFRGIPYAKPLVGKMALLPPETPETWDLPRDCTSFGPACPQKDPSSSTLTIFGAPGDVELNYGSVGEECLNLNITTPPTSLESSPDAASSNTSNTSYTSNTPLLPVIVWIHGGANKQGSNAEAGVFLDAHAFGDEEVVSVSVNYRLGLLGFGHLTSSPHSTSQNLALKDLHLSLDWIQRNIQEFGGDPANITLLGESAGAVNISALLASPVAPGKLFHRAILSSGGPNDLPINFYDKYVKSGLFTLNVDGIAHGSVMSKRTSNGEEREEKDRENKNVNENENENEEEEEAVLGVAEDEPTPLLLEGLEYGETGGSGMTMSDYQSTQSKDTLLEEHNAALSPSMWCHISGTGGEGDVLPHPILSAVRHGSAHSVPLLIGHNSDEFPGFLRALLRGKNVPDSIARAAVTEIFKRGGVGGLRDEVMLRHALRDYEGKATSEQLQTLLSDLKNKLRSDLGTDATEEQVTSRLFNLLATAPASALAAAQASTGTSVWTYEIDLDEKDSPMGGNFHGLDLILLFCREMFYEPKEHEMISNYVFGRKNFGGGVNGAGDAWRKAIVNFATDGRPDGRSSSVEQDQEQEQEQKDTTCKKEHNEGDWAAPLRKDGQGEMTIIGSSGKITKSSGGRYYFG